jgi:ATP-binding cassette subfamily F protein uup
MTILCSLQNLSLSYPHKLIFKDVTFTLNQGDKIGILGLNGHGKSSLMKVITGEVTPDTTTPSFVMDKSKQFSFFHVPQELSKLEHWDIENYFYEFYPDLKKIKIRLDEVNLKLATEMESFDKLINEQSKLLDELHKLGEEKLHSQYVSYLKYFGMKDLSRKMTSLSGGEQRKVALSLGLSAPQELILWDEPTNHLDLETIEALEEELQGSNKTFMIISHDRSLLNNVVDRIFHIERGKLKTFSGTYEAYLQFLVEDQARREKELDKLSNIQRRETAWIRRGVQARRTKSKKRIEDYGSLNKKIEDLKSQSHRSVDLNLVSSGRKTKQLISAENIALSFGERTLFKELSFTINKGDKISLLGRNGVGKSSLLRCLLGEMAPTQGSIHRAQNLDVGYFSQKRESLKDNETPWSIIGEGIDYVISNTGDKRHVASYLENFLFTSDEIKRPIHTFSGGEKNRLQLAQFMKHSRDIWIFDEPTNDLDLETIGILEEELRNYEGALIVVGHDRSFIQNVTDKCWVLSDQGLDIFEAGFSQAEQYLEALALEDQLKSLSQAKESQQKQSGVKTKSSNKDRNRFDEVGKEIEVLEGKINHLNQLLAQAFDQKLADDLTRCEGQLEHLFEEWAEIEKRLV